MPSTPEKLATFYVVFLTTQKPPLPSHYVKLTTDISIHVVIHTTILDLSPFPYHNLPLNKNLNHKHLQPTKPPSSAPINPLFNQFKLFSQQDLPTEPNTQSVSNKQPASSTPAPHDPSHAHSLIDTPQHHYQHPSFPTVQNYTKSQPQFFVTLQQKTSRPANPKSAKSHEPLLHIRAPDHRQTPQA